MFLRTFDPELGLAYKTATIQIPTAKFRGQNISAPIVAVRPTDFKARDWGAKTSGLSRVIFEE